MMTQDFDKILTMAARAMVEDKFHRHEQSHTGYRLKRTKTARESGYDHGYAAALFNVLRMLAPPNVYPHIETMILEEAVQQGYLNDDPTQIPRYTLPKGGR